ncbi:MAG: Fur family transcriptional regulator [Paracoccaceae bacterium]|nr:Fur family transcriptional regulator [Paracoccaceae bacterium]
MGNSILKRCKSRGLRMTGQRQVIARVLESADDHPDAEEIYARASKIDSAISLATVYRTMRLFEDVGLVNRLDFGDGRARYEDASRAHHDHLFDMETGRVIEFVDPEIEQLQEKIARKLGYRLLGHKMDLFAVPLDKDEDG